MQNTQDFMNAQNLIQKSDVVNRVCRGNDYSDYIKHTLEHLQPATEHQEIEENNETWGIMLATSDIKTVDDVDDVIHIGVDDISAPPHTCSLLYGFILFKVFAPPE